MRRHLAFSKEYPAMRKQLTLTFLVFLLAPLSVCAQSQPPSVDVTATADVKVIPDEVFIAFGVETSDASLAVAKSQNDATVRKLLDLTRQFQIDPRNVQTDFIVIEPWQHDLRNGESRREFRIRKNLAITLKVINKFEDLLSRALEIGVTNVHGVQFRTTELRKHRDRARGNGDSSRP
jgi:uncharacterized protein